MKTIGWRRGICAGLLAALGLLAADAFGSDRVQKSEMKGISPIIATYSEVEPGDKAEWMIRSRVVQFDPTVLHQVALAVDERPRITLALFDDLTITVEVRRASVQSENRFTIFGVVPRSMAGHASITVRNSAVAGYVTIPGVGEFTIRGAENGLQRVTQVDSNKMPLCTVGLEPQPEVDRPKLDVEPPIQMVTDEPIVVTVLGFYSDSAAQEAGGEAELMALLDNDIERTNTILANSEINVVLKPLAYFITNYNEDQIINDQEGLFAAVMGKTLGMLANGDILVGIVGPPTTAYREVFCADLVLMIVNYPGIDDEGMPIPCGIADLPPSASVANYEYAHSVVRVMCMPGATVAHEFGHNFGAGHDHFSEGSGTFPYSHGHRWWVPGTVQSDFLVRTLMAYPPGIPIDFFSNPEVEVPSGFPTGIAPGPPNQADNALTVMNIAPFVASYGEFICDFSTVREVGGGPGTYATIQAAINAADSGDHILVHPGTYLETINLHNKSLHIRSLDGPNDTIIDGSTNPGNSVVTIAGGQNHQTAIQGFTLRNADNALRGGGVTIANSSPTIADCVIENNSVLLSGGGMHIDNGAPLIWQTTFVDNYTPNRGGGVFIRGGAPKIHGSVFIGNTADGNGGAIFVEDSPASIKDTIIGYLDPDSPNAAQRNEAGGQGGGIFIQVDPDEDEEDWVLPHLTSSQLCGNLPNNISGPWENLGENNLCAAEADINVPADYPTIQEAINVANDGDVIVVAPGTYFERIDFKGKAIHLRSTDPTDPDIVAATTINGQGQGTVVKFVDDEEIDSILAGFTITGGSATNGGGILIQGSSPTIEHCVLMNNTAGSVGGGMAAIQSAGVIRDCRFINNTANTGGGLYSENSTNLSVQNCTFEGNHASSSGGAMANFLSAGPTINNAMFEGNTATIRGGAIYNASNGNPLLINSAIRNNSSGEGGGGVHSTNNSQARIAHTVFCGNSPVHIQGPWDNLGNVTFTDVCPPLNNLPSNAQPVGGETATIFGSFEGATNDGSASCEPDGVDVFFSYPVTLPGAPFTVDTCGSGDDTALAVFDPVGNEIGCSDDCDGLPCGAPDACLTVTPLVAGEYLIRVSQVPPSLTGAPTGTFVLNVGTPPDTIPGDLNGDGIVDGGDLLILLSEWGECPPQGECPADLNNDGTVDGSDLLILLSNWGSWD